MQVPLVDLKAQYAPIREEILAAVTKVLDSMALYLGPNLVEVEKQFAEYCQAAYCVGNGSGTEAINLALRAANIGKGDEVITVSHSFIATTEGIWQAEATPVYVDIDPKTYNMDVTQVEAKITPRTRAILPVHMHGQMANMAALREIADRHNLILMEDSAQAHGATWDGKPAGSWGDLACFSFYASKNLGAYGDAGAVTCNKEEYAKRMKVLRDHGSTIKYVHSEMGFNNRMDEVQASILRVKLPYLNGWTEGRRRIAAKYTELLQGSGVGLPHVDPRGNPVWHHYAITSEHRDDLKHFLQEKGVFAGIHYPIPIHLQEASKMYGYKEGDLPVTEWYAKSTLSLPIYAEMTDEQVEYVAACVHEYMKSKSEKKELVGAAD
jgi:dTDP-4-amino-4,6-dideoxygalactose transaminase